MQKSYYVYALVCLVDGRFEVLTLHPTATLANEAKNDLVDEAEACIRPMLVDCGDNYWGATFDLED